jgi:hypothetical protein
MYTALYIGLKDRLTIQHGETILDVDRLVFIGQAKLKVISVPTKIAFFETVMKCALLDTQCISKIPKSGALPKWNVFYGIQMYFYSFPTTILGPLVHNTIYSTFLSIFPNGLHNS